MSTRFMCDNCGHQPCLCQEFECPTCEGAGVVNRQHLRPQNIECETCHGEGSVKCDGPRSISQIPPAEPPSCPWEADELGGFCRCERAWDRQQEDYAAEPPISARERQEMEYHQKQELRR